MSKEQRGRAHSSIEVVDTRLGVLRVKWAEAGVCGVEFGGGSGERRGSKVARELQAYAEGRRVKWSVPVDLSEGTEFQRAVWQVLREIPYGETRSYAWVARRVGRPRAARAVGAACGANPVPVLVPCHRVVASDGSLGGFSGGLAWKRKLLRLEGVTL